MELITLDRLENYLSFFHKMYDAVRLVDPIEKRVIDYRGACAKNTDEVCYHYWSDSRICDNCISVRSYVNNNCFMKLEKADRAIMMVTAMPIENAERPTVIELLKNATDTMMIGMGIYSDGHMMHDYIRELNERVIKDELTGVYNRRYADERLPVDIVRALVDKQPLSAIFLDIDNLKESNDRYGHAFGDRLIQHIAGVLSQSIRQNSDWVARYGGDEFLICLNGTPSHVARLIAERIQARVQDAEGLVTTRESEIRTSVSIGVYTVEEEPLTAQELVALADERMYKAKQQGKNRVVSE